MGSGLSMTSVNKIKELATSREYSLALEIIDSQDLTKSLNPQFIRLCGEVYIANKRYEDARRVLIMAHRMAPEAKRVIYSLVDLYLRMGYKDLADFYYRLYMFDAEPNLPQTDHINYIYKKAQGCPLEEIATLLFPVYSDEMDYDWSFELYLLMKLQGKEEEAKAIKEGYVATFKSEPNVALIEELEQSDDRLEELFYVYSKENIADDLPEQEQLRQEEKPLLEADEHRMNPKEAEIQIVFDDNEKVTFSEKLKYKKHMKEQEKLARKAEKENGQDGEENPEAAETAEQTEGTDIEAQGQDTEATDNPEVKVSIFKKLFSKKKTEDTEAAENAENIESEETDKEVEADNKEELEETTDEITEDIESIQSQEQTELVSDEPEASAENDVVLEDTVVDVVDENIMDEEAEEVVSEELVNEEVDTATEEESEQEATEDMGDSVMQEIYGKKKISIVTELGEDTFINTQEFDSGNPFDELLKKEDKEPDKDSEKDSDTEQKPAFVFEEVELLPEDDSELEVDDFTDVLKVSDFEEEESTEDVQSVDNTDVSDNTEMLEDVEATEVADTVIEISSDFETYPEFEVESDFEDDVEAEEVEPEADIEAEEVELQAELEADAETAIETDVEDSVEEHIEDNIETDATYQDAEEEKSQEQPVEAEEYKDPFSVLEGESVYNSLKEKGSMDFPEFKSSLFPELGQEVAEVENNFDEIMTEAQDKINENLLKEEQMQREAEALLASLGIDLGSVKPTIKPEDASLGFASKLENTATQSVAMSNPTPEPPKKVEEQMPEAVQESVNNYSPSRDELKASLKIDSVKKNILKQIKEYR